MTDYGLLYDGTANFPYRVIAKDWPDDCWYVRAEFQSKDDAETFIAGLKKEWEDA